MNRGHVPTRTITHTQYFSNRHSSVARCVISSQNDIIFSPIKIRSSTRAPRRGARRSPRRVPRRRPPAVSRRTPLRPRTNGTNWTPEENLPLGKRSISKDSCPKSISNSSPLSRSRPKTTPKRTGKLRSRNFIAKIPERATREPSRPWRNPTRSPLKANLRTEKSKKTKRTPTGHHL